MKAEEQARKVASCVPLVHREAITLHLKKIYMKLQAQKINWVIISVKQTA